MNLSKSAFRRYKVIDGMLRNSMRKYPTIIEIQEACYVKLDFRPSIETLQKDMANMRAPYPDGFDAPIQYCKINRGYEYTDPNYTLTGITLREDEIDAITDALDLIKMIGGSRISHQFNQTVEKLFSFTLDGGASLKNRRPFVQIMIPPVSRGFEHFDLFYEACKERQTISMLHFSYNKRTFTHTYFHPFLIKEFENHWYLIGFSETHKAIRTFGLDRISAPLKTKKKFIHSELSEIDTYLNDVYGVFPIPGAQKEKVKIKASKLSTHYFQAYPLHESQAIKKNPSGTSEISFELIPSIELAQYFLSRGSHVTLLSPTWFVNFTKDLSQ
ncbi:MAG: WYL domain-containing protein [Flavobacteriia bacterium]|nr:WYL domain-containing protein [Flavobacteriia bacterium]